MRLQHDPRWSVHPKNVLHSARSLEPRPETPDMQAAMSEMGRDGLNKRQATKQNVRRTHVPPSLIKSFQILKLTKIN